jgi:hypothetical protein
MIVGDTIFGDERDTIPRRRSIEDSDGCTEIGNLDYDFDMLLPAHGRAI